MGDYREITRGFSSSTAVFALNCTDFNRIFSEITRGHLSLNKYSEKGIY